jgi:hypothetical protein
MELNKTWKIIFMQDEAILERINFLKITLGFVPVGEPMQNVPLQHFGMLILTNRRVIVEWLDKKLKLYSTLGIYGLSERLMSNEKPIDWPYQGILMLIGGMNLLVEPFNKTEEEAGKLSTFLNKALFTYGKRETDNASLAAMNAYLERLRRESSSSNESFEIKKDEQKNY